ncbi:MAG: hypothetical protein ABFD92_14435 [Planctomycetaceae bacterium]|nr:hypothetical protein [Planctomycetaceae bacterium]
MTLLMGLSLTVAAGCPVHQDQNTPVGQKLERDPVTGRGYWIYVPSTYSPERAAPLIITCHGTPPFDVSEMHIREWKMLGERNGCIILAPALEGTDGILGDGPLGSMQVCERSILSLVSMVGYRYNIDRANIMITGFSGGGFPAYFVGLRHPEIFNVVVARNCNFSESNLHDWYPTDAVQMPVMVYWGENDPLTIILQSRNAVNYLRSRGFIVDTSVVAGAGHDRHPEFAMAFMLKNRRTPRPSLPVKTVNLLTTTVE